ncbi:MAG: secretion protein HlyD [Alphaproteobacteria bacterium]|nr:MAG: secretion protein HlyD [Alphaproteobacteria bacterium]
MAKDKKKKEDAKPNLNNAKDWERLHKSTFSRQMNKLEAYGDKLLDTDEDLPLARHLQLFTIVAMVLVFIVWANYATLDEITRGEGKIVPSSEVQIIQHQEGGTIQALLVKEGDTVDAGQILMRLSDVGASSELGTTSTRILGLQAKVQRLQAEAEGKSAVEFTDEVMEGAPESVKEELNSFRANKAQLGSQILVLKSQLSQRRAEVSEVNTRIRDTQRMIDLTQEEMNMLQPLVARGSAPKRDILQLEQQKAQQRSEINGLRASIPRANSAIREAQARIKDIETTMRTTAQNDLTLAVSEIKTLQQQIPALKDRKTRTDIRSPVRGIVKDIKVQTSDGSGVIKPGDAVMEIVPLDDQLVVEANIRPADIAFLHPGQEGIVKITAYDFSIYGGLKGTVTAISADTITNQKGESFYKIKLTTSQTSIIRNGVKLPIIPGMVASVDILTGEKTVMEYLMKPLVKTLNQSLNER